jgi:DNA invertase Pin-like site-specific DNA recombinase
MKPLTGKVTTATSQRNRPIRAAIYVRISQDRTGAGLGVERQEEDCRALCASHGWQVVHVYVDNDVSAYSRRPRPQWQQMLADIHAGRIDAIVCWHVDRLTRSPRELEDVIDLHDSLRVELATATGEIDLSTPTGRMIARTLGAAARHEAEHKAERQARERRQQAQAGKPHSSGTRGYGYADDKVSIVDAEAGVITEAARRVLAGEALRSIARDLNDRAIPSARGGQWMAPVLKGVLTSARISGRREYHGDIVADDAWPAIITPADSDQLRALLNRPGKPAATARTYLYSGILRCHQCHKGLGGRPHHGRSRYICAKAPGNGRCGTVAVYADLADAEVRDKVLTALDTPKLFARIMSAAGGGSDTKKVTDALRGIDAQRKELAAMWAAKELTRAEWMAARDELRAEADALTASLASTEHARALAEFAAMDGELWERFAALPDGGKRALVAATVHHITVHPAQGRRTWDPDRIDPTWRA